MTRRSAPSISVDILEADQQCPTIGTRTSCASPKSLTLRPPLRKRRIMSRIPKVFRRRKSVSTFLRFNRVTLLGADILFCFPTSVQQAITQSVSGAHDPGVRIGQTGAGGFIAGLTRNQRAYFAAGLDEFNQIEPVKRTVSDGGGL